MHQSEPDPAAPITDDAASARARIADLEARLARTEAELHQTQRTAHVGSWTWHVREDRLDWSPEMYRIFGVDEATFTGSLPEVIAAAIHPDDRAAVEASNRAVAEEGRPVPLHYRVVRPDGSVRTVWAEAGHLETDAGGAPLRLSGIVLDVTERAAAEQALRASELRWKFAVEGTGDGLWDWSVPDGSAWFSDGWKALLGYGPEEIEGHVSEWESRTHPDDLARAYAALQEHFAGRTPVYVIEIRMRHRDGRWIRILDRGMVVERGEDGAPLRMIGTHRDVTARVEAEEARRASEARYRALVERFPGIVYTYVSDHGATYVSPQVTGILGYPPERILAEPMLWHDSIHPDDVEAVDAAVAGAALGIPVSVEYRIRDAAGDWRWLEDRSTRVRDDHGRLVIDGFAVEVTERRLAAQEHARIVDELAAARHLEALGRLAGGVAHDFNNMLGAILGHAELALLALDPDAEVRTDLQQIEVAARRSADLTRQLLAFARRQAVAPRPVDLDRHVEGMLVMLRRLIGEDVELSWRPAGDLPPVVVDPSQLDQLLANLCVNARDAIDGVGRISISTELALGDPLAPFAALVVADDGCGMDEATRRRIFEPFFTTKALGQGTGLGLATVHGIVEQHGGRVEVASVLGEGTTFRVLLPCGVAAPAEAVDAPARPVGGTETILLVEDEPTVLGPTVRILERLGYRVIAAASPEEGLRLAMEHPEDIDLLLSDVVMPGMNGWTLAGLVAASRPGIRCVFMSGYTADVLERQGSLDASVSVVAKPFSGPELAAAVRAALDRAPWVVEATG